MASFAVEGSVGSGKSCTLEALRLLKPAWVILEEPVWQWQNFSPAEGVFVDLLKDWYETPCERSFRLLQTQVVQSLLERYTFAENKGAEVTVFERSLQVSLEVFLVENKSQLFWPEYHLLENLCKWGVEKFEQTQPQVYLKCNEVVMVSRVVKRGRSSERFMRLQQLFSVQRKMDEWARNAGMHTIDTSDLTPVEVAEAVVEWSGLR